MHLVNSLPCDGRTTKIKLSADGSAIATLNGAHTITLWDAVNFRETASFALKDSIRDFALSPDLSLLAVITAADLPGKSMASTSQVHLFDITSNSVVREQSLLDVRSVTLLMSEGPIALGRLKRGSSVANAIDFLDLGLSANSASVEFPQDEMPLELTALAKLDLLISLGIGVALWKMSTKQLIQHIHCDNLEVDWDIWEASCFCTAPQQDLLAIGFTSFNSKTRGPKVCLFDTTSWKALKWLFDEVEYPTSAAISFDGKQIAITGSGKTFARVWDIESDSLLGECNVEGINVVAFSPNGRYIITGANSTDIWEL